MTGPAACWWKIATRSPSRSCASGAPISTPPSHAWPTRSDCRKPMSGSRFSARLHAASRCSGRSPSCSTHRWRRSLPCARASSSCRRWWCSRCRRASIRPTASQRTFSGTWARSRTSRLAGPSSQDSKWVHWSVSPGSNASTTPGCRAWTGVGTWWSTAWAARLAIRSARTIPSKVRVCSSPSITTYRKRSRIHSRRRDLTAPGCSWIRAPAKSSRSQVSRHTTRMRSRQAWIARPGMR
jgi:hypothetical protein